MKQHSFEQQYAPQWETLERWLAAQERDTPKAPTQAEVAARTPQFPGLYRQVCHHLALARARHYTPYLIRRLDRLVARGHHILYGQRRASGSAWLRFVAADFPRLVRAEAALVLAAALLFFGPMLGIGAAIQLNPSLVYTLLDHEQVNDVEQMYDPDSSRWGKNRDSDSDFLMFGYYIMNNTGIGFRTFAGGILFGLGTLFFLIFNGLFIGAVAGHLTYAGYIVPFYSFVAGHSGLELTAIVLSGAAGLKLGLALLRPQRMTRLRSLKASASTILPMVYGAAGMFIMAAFVEGFWSSNAAIDPLIKYSVGIVLWALVLGYFGLAGRARRR